MVDVLFDIPLTSILGREMYLPIPKPPTPDQIQVHSLSSLSIFASLSLFLFPQLIFLFSVLFSSSGSSRCLKRIYFSFGTPISTEAYQGQHENDEHVKEVRDKTRQAVMDQIEMLKGVQESDPDSKRLNQILKKSKLFQR